jgi:hypothetical protein
MSKIEEIEQVVEQLALTDFAKLTVWIDQRRQRLEIPPSATDKSQTVLRDHSAFLNSYVPQDEGLYDDAAARSGRTGPRTDGRGQTLAKAGSRPRWRFDSRARAG